MKVKVVVKRINTYTLTLMTLALSSATSLIMAWPANAVESNTASTDDWVESCRKMAMRPADELIGACETEREYKQKQNVIYYDKKYLSFKIEEYCYEGGAHGNTKITVGVFERKNGKRLKLVDLIPPNKFSKLQGCLYEAVVKKIGGKKNLLGEVKPIENFYINKDGLHFVYNEYDVACYAMGAIDVVVDFPFE